MEKSVVNILILCSITVTTKSSPTGLLAGADGGIGRYYNIMGWRYKGS
ncbi:hypothetical protein ACVXHB_11670 [Escherichia coli]